MKFLNNTIKIMLLSVACCFASCSDDNDGKLAPWMTLTNEMGNVLRPTSSEASLS